MTAPTRNVDLLIRVLEAVIREDAIGGAWNQSTWRALDNDIYMALRRSADGLPSRDNLPPLPDLSERCTTAMCFAGWAAELDGSTDYVLRTGEDWLAWMKGRTNASADMLVATQEEIDLGVAFLIQHGGQEVRTVTADSRARRLLGLTAHESDQLFNGSNDVEDLVRMVTNLIAGRDIDHVVPGEEELVADYDPAYV